MKKFFIGVDVSKDTVDVSFFDDDRMKSPEYLAQYSNSPKGFREMVKDLRTGVETSNVEAVLDDGDLDPFVIGYHRWATGNADAEGQSA